jgi:Cellulase (glycosyl hydrolase family 5)
VIRSDPAAEELQAQRSALRKQQFQERLRTERAPSTSPLQRARERNEARRNEASEAEQRATGAIQAREDPRATSEAEKAAPARSAEQQATPAKEEQRATRRARTADRIQHEEAAQATLERQAGLRTNGIREKQNGAREEEAEVRAQRERDLKAAIQQKREQQQQLRAAARAREQEPARRGTKTPADESAQQSRARHGVGDEARGTGQTIQAAGRTDRESRAAIIARQQHEQAESEALQRRQQEEARAAERRQLRATQQAHAQTREQSETQRAQAAKARVVQRRAELTSPQDTAMRPRIVSGPVLAPRSLAGAGSTARGVSSGASAAAEQASGEQVTDTVPYLQTPYLQTQGSFIVDENGDAVILRGVTVRGLDTAAPQAGQLFPAALGIDPENLAAMTGQWSANVIRLPFAANTILSGNGTLAASAVLTGLDQTVAAITQAGAYVLLALEAAVGEEPLDANTIQVWETLAARYEAEPRVLYELFFSTTSLAGNAPAQFVSLVGTVLQENPGALIFMRAGSGGIDVSGVPLLAPSGEAVPNIVYTIAVSSQNMANTDSLSATAAAYPVFASVWSDDGSDLGRLASRIADLFERYGIGWAAANWNAVPGLVADAAGHDFTPTVWGHVAQGAIKLTVPPLLEPSDAAASLSTLQMQNPKPSRLTTSGNFILDENRNAIALRGVSVVGLDTGAPATGQTLPDALGIDENNLALMTGTWGLNLVRLPFQAQTVLSGSTGLSAGNLLAGLDLAVALISDAGAYVLLALGAPAGGEAPPTPDSSTLQALQMLARRYQNESGVLFEIFASPLPLAPNWLQTAAALITTIRQQNPSTLIFVGSGNGGVDVTGLPLQIQTGTPVFNLVYTVSVSPQSFPGPDDGPLGVFADLYPVFVSTWSDDPSNVSRLSPYAAEFFGRHSMGFAASNWNADPRLVTDAIHHNFTATAWGLIAGRAAALPVRSLLKPFLTS